MYNSMAYLRYSLSPNESYSQHYYRSFESQIRIEGDYLPIFKKEIEKMKDLY